MTDIKRRQKFWRRAWHSLAAPAFWRGVASVMDLGGAGFRPAYPPRRLKSAGEAFAEDAAAIRSDWEAVLGRDLGRKS
jgi:hypothetical protein